MQTDNSGGAEPKPFSWTTIIEQTGSTGSTRAMPKDVGGSTTAGANAPDLQQYGCQRRF
jgi:hypothetical protein